MQRNLAAHYAYTPFGAMVLTRGESASANPWRFSSEFAENDIATVYYNYRPYNVQDGRWMLREKFPFFVDNLYLFIKNRAHSVDCLGLYDVLVHYYLMYALMQELGYNDCAKKIAAGSQYPDTGIWDAMNGGLWPNKDQAHLREVFHNLNSLNACEIFSFRRCISKKIQEEIDPFLKGVYLHVLADTFAHVDPDTKCSYDSKEGHFWDGTSPDDVQWRMHGREVGRERLYGLIDEVKRAFGRENVDTPKMTAFLKVLYEHNYLISESVWWYFYTPSRQIPKYAHKMGLSNDANPKEYGNTKDQDVLKIMPKLEECLRRSRNADDGG